jgi:hypothetical protein
LLIFIVEDIFGSMMTYLEKDVLPFPHVKKIDLGPAMKRKVVAKKNILLWDFNFLEFYRRKTFSLCG